MGAGARVESCDTVRTVDVSPRARIRVRPAFVEQLDDDDLTFVMAHELMHLLLRTHTRAKRFDPRAFNWAHDAIINDVLVHTLHSRIPADGVTVPGARFTNAERLIDDMTGAGRAPWDEGYDGDVVTESLGRPRSFGGDGDSGGGGGWRTLTVSLFTDEEIDDDTEAKCARAFEHHRISGRVRARSPKSGAATSALAAWLERARGRERTFARPSRRRPDAIARGRRAVSEPIVAIVDVSSSVVSDHATLLGALRDACATAGVEELRVVQADRAITSDRVVDARALGDLHLEGSGDEEVVVMPSPCSSCGAHHGIRLKRAPRTDLAHAFVNVRPASFLIVVTDGWLAAAGPRPRCVDAVWLTVDAFEPPWGRSIAIGRQ